MRTPTLKALLARKQKAGAKLVALILRRSRLKTLAARLKLIPDIVVVSGVIINLERQIAKRAKKKGASLPFQISPEAESYIRVCLRPPSGMRPTLFLALGFEAYEEARLIAQFEGEHFLVGYDHPNVVEQWPKFLISNTMVWIDEGTLHHLRGKTLALRILDFPVEHSKILVTA